MRLIQRLLLWLILFYRRFFSGRIPNVRCSFVEESCSTFGLRVTRMAASGREAVGRVLRRLRRCGDACLLSDGTSLAWSELHDGTARDIVGEMRADGERDASIAHMLRTRMTVARWCGDRATFEDCRRTIHALAMSVTDKPRAVSLAVVQRRSRVRLVVLAVVGVVATIATAFVPLVAAPVAVIAWLGAWSALRRMRSRIARFVVATRQRTGATSSRALERSARA